MSGRIDWAALMRAGLGEMRLAPETFWAMTPREFDAAANPWRALQAEPMDRDAFAALRARYPDTKGTGE